MLERGAGVERKKRTSWGRVIGVAVGAAVLLLLLGLLAGLTSWRYRLSLQGLLLLLLLVALLSCLLLELWDVSLSFFLCNCLLLWGGLLPVERAIEGFANSSIVAVGAMFVVARGVEKVRLMDWTIRNILGRPSSLRMALLSILPPLLVLSAFTNNTPIVAVMIPMLQTWSIRVNLPVSKLLMPVSFAVILGGVCTIIGTSTNLVVAALSQPLGIQLSFFGVGALGLPFAVVGCAYLIFASPILMRENRERAGQYMPRFWAWHIVKPKSPHVGKSLRHSGLCDLPGAELVWLKVKGKNALPVYDLKGMRERGEDDNDGTGAEDELRRMVTTRDLEEDVAVVVVVGNGNDNNVESSAAAAAIPDDFLEDALISAPEEYQHALNHVLEPQDMLLFVGPGECVEDLHGLRRRAEGDVRLDRLSFFEIFLSSGFAGCSVSRFEHDFHCRIRFVNRDGSTLHRFKGGLVGGDVLFVEGDLDLLHLHFDVRFDEVREVPRARLEHFSPSLPPLVRLFHPWIALLCLIWVVVPTAIGLLPLYTAASMSVVLLIASGILNWKEVLDAVPGNLLIMISCSYALSAAMGTTGVGPLLGESFAKVFTPPAYVQYLGIYLVTNILTALSSNTAAAAIMFPICVQFSVRDGLNMEGALYVLMIAASADFMTPFGYQTNLMVQKPGGYKFLDYPRLGFPLSLLGLFLVPGLAAGIYPSGGGGAGGGVGGNATAGNVTSGLRFGGN